MFVGLSPGAGVFPAAEPGLPAASDQGLPPVWPTEGEIPA